MPQRRDRVSLRVGTDESGYQTQLTVQVNPPPGERWSSQGTAEAMKFALETAFKAAAAATRARGSGRAALSVVPGDAWSGGATARLFFDFESEDDLATVHDAVNQVVREASGVKRRR